MNGKMPLKFGTVEIAAAEIIGDAMFLRLEILEGVVNKEELRMLIQFLQAKQDLLYPL